jgi:hypothetical protein
MPNTSSQMCVQAATMIIPKHSTHSQHPQSSTDGNGERVAVLGTNTVVWYATYGRMFWRMIHCKKCTLSTNSRCAASWSLLPLLQNVDGTLWAIPGLPKDPGQLACLTRSVRIHCKVPKLHKTPCNLHTSISDNISTEGLAPKLGLGCPRERLSDKLQGPSGRWREYYIVLHCIHKHTSIQHMPC